MELFGDDLPKAVKDITNTNGITLKISRETKQSIKRSRKDGHLGRYQSRYKNNYSGPSQNYCQHKGLGEECSEEPELSLDQIIDATNIKLQDTGRLKYFFFVWQAITSGSHILDMVEHCHLKFISNPYQHQLQPREN